MSKKFDKLANKVEQEYIRKGYSRKRSEEIGAATAGKVYREKKIDAIEKKSDSV